MRSSVAVASRRACVVLGVLAVLVVSAAVGPAVAQLDDEEGGTAAEGGLEGRLEGFVAGQGLAGAILVLVGGVVLLTACVEKLISYLTRAALGLRLSLFAFALVFTGFEFDDTVLGLALASGGLEGAALGTALGTGLAIVGVTLAVAAVVKPFPVDLPTDYVALFVLSPLVLVPFVLVGTLTLVHGVALIGLFVLAVAYLVAREFRRDTPVFRNSDLGAAIRPDGGATLPTAVAAIPEDRFVSGRAHAGLIWVALAVVALVGIVVASMLLEAGSEVAIESLGIEQTVFGATVLTAILTFEDVMLTLEPVRRGVPEIGVGNVIGSVLFSVTANVGVIVVVSELTITPSVLTFHLPAIVLLTALAGFFLARGELKRWHGVLLGSLYVAYWVVAFVVFGGVPLSG